MSKVVGIDAAREYMFRTASQITLNYHDGPLSAGKAGRVRGGDRLPWVAVDGGDNFASSRAIAWQVHVYGAASDALGAWCAGRGLALHRFDWRQEYGAAGLERNAAYLLRPDTYVALADPTGSPGAFEQYLTARGIDVGAAGVLG